MLWAEGRDLAGGTPLWVPLDLVTADYALDGPPSGGFLQATTNGLASGNTRAEALVHALAELAERDAHALWLALPPAARAETAIDPGSVADPLCADLLARFAAPLRRYRRYIERDLRPLHRDEEIAVLGLNTARPMGLHWNWSHGRINADQIAHARSVFDSVGPDVFKVVVTHHPFLPPPDAPDTRLVGRAGLALRTFEHCGVDLLLAGHLHRGYHGDVRTHHTAVKRSILVAQASTATSTRLRNEPNAYNFITIEGTGEDARVTFLVRSWEGARFTPGLKSQYVKRGHRWELQAQDPGLSPAS